jgi:hypothetical protein
MLYIRPNFTASVAIVLDGPSDRQSGLTCGGVGCTTECGALTSASHLTNPRERWSLSRKDLLGMALTVALVAAGLPVQRFQIGPRTEVLWISALIVFALTLFFKAKRAGNIERIGALSKRVRTIHAKHFGADVHA